MNKKTIYKLGFITYPVCFTQMIINTQPIYFGISFTTFIFYLSCHTLYLSRAYPTNTQQNIIEVTR